MIVIEKNEGLKIPYEVDGTRICFNDDLTINVAKREKDWLVHIDVCFNSDGAFVIGAAAGRTYVAEIDVPKAEYIFTPSDEDPDADGMDGGGTSTLVSFNMDDVTLSLWAIE